MSKYPISKEFGIYRFMKTPIMPGPLAGWVGSLMRPPRWIWHDRQVAVRAYRPAGEGQGPEALLFSPRELHGKAPCLVYFHGGGFVFGASGAHYRIARQYALGAGCRVLFVQYRLAPRHRHPIPVEDCYLSYQWAVENAEQLELDASRMALGGDSAGGCLCAAVAQMCRDRGASMPLFQLFIYPVTDRRMDTESNRRFTDTPMWNSRLSAAMWQNYLPEGPLSSPAYASPMEAATLAKLPPAYVELAEFDCLHDEGLAYAQRLQAAGVPVELNDTHGTMHGYEIAWKAPTVQSAIQRRIAYMRAHLSSSAQTAPK